MGNEASLEGGEGPLSGLPEGLAPDGKGGFVRVPEGTPVNLAELSEEQRRQLAAVMSRAQGRQPGGAAAARRQGFFFFFFFSFLYFFFSVFMHLKYQHHHQSKQADRQAGRLGRVEIRERGCVVFVLKMLLTPIS